MISHRFGFMAAAAIMAAAIAGPATAAVIYSFEASSSFNGQNFGSFTVTVPGFITQDMWIDSANLSSCTIISGPNTVCGPQGFDVDDGFGRAVIAFGTLDPVLDPDDKLYYFSGTSLSTLGTHDTVLFGTIQQGRLTVALAPVPPTPPAIPEPASWLMMITGFGAVGAMLRRRRPVTA